MGPKFIYLLSSPSPPSSPMTTSRATIWEVPPRRKPGQWAHSDLQCLLSNIWKQVTSSILLSFTVVHGKKVTSVQLFCCSWKWDPTSVCAHPLLGLFRLCSWLYTSTCRVPQIPLKVLLEENKGVIFPTGRWKPLKRCITGEHASAVCCQEWQCR